MGDAAAEHHDDPLVFVADDPAEHTRALEAVRHGRQARCRVRLPALARILTQLEAAGCTAILLTRTADEIEIHLLPEHAQPTTPPGARALLPDDAPDRTTATAPAATPAAVQRAIIYAGPHPALLLDDGRVLRRGVALRLEAERADPLRAAGLALDLPAAYAGAATAPATLAQLATAGVHPASTPLPPLLPQPRREPDLDALADIGEPLARQLRRTIDARRPYFELTGTDPADTFGCCPSAAVGQAYALVAAGLLEARRISPPEAERVRTAFAFDGEPRGDDPAAAQIDDALRSRVRERLRVPARVAWSRFLLRWGLLSVVAAALVVTGLRVYARSSAPDADADLATAVALPAEDCVLVCLLKGDQDCEPCRVLEDVARRVVREDFAAARAANRLAFTVVPYQQPRYRSLRERYRLVALAMLVVVRVADGEQVDETVIADSTATVLDTDPDALARSLRTAIDTALKAE